ncbi:ATP-dependent nuclease [Aestuariivivens sediminis]|uniref:ATP-dependent nuclease n=1 Tax=Aestuariivivens sediminis TaxID=2913557 RepID=UPI001F5AC40C|nr:AAA family ATPase [Aestuariivivens sediminis]
MNLTTVNIKNFRSINDLTIEVKSLEDNSFTYGLIGINEAGKSSILRALSFKDNFDSFTPTLKDFNDRNKPIEVNYKFLWSSKDVKSAKELLKTKMPSTDFAKLDLSEVMLNITIQVANLNAFTRTVTCLNIEAEDSEKEQINKHLVSFFSVDVFRTIFWKADDKFLISKPIALAAFSQNPNSSIPLKNCFYLAGVEDIKGQIALLTESTEREYLAEELGKKVTEHIKNVWKEHPVKITFNISDGNVNFHVKDENASGRAKTADQRSDGFKQFISFLLTVSAENRNNELENTLLLLDEPETHLHPTAQENLLDELIKITKSKNNNTVFFATHSNYMIDKNYLNRNIKVTKPEENTTVSFYDKKSSSYASVNYDVFNIISADYHNELYGRAFVLSGIDNGTDFDKKISELHPTVTIKKDYVSLKGKKFDCTLPTYVRHLIHHPENNKNEKYTQTELKRSIKNLLLVIRKLENKNP